MALPQGINFRNTVGFVTDGVNEDAEVTTASPDYPFTTAQGNTVGWESTNFGSGLQTRNRDSGNDRRLAGSAFNNDSSNQLRFRVDLQAAGNHRVGLAAGDPNYSVTTKVVLFDGLTQLSVLVNGSTSAPQRFFDATGVELTNVTWPTNQALVEFNFANTILRVISDGVTQMLLNHLYVESAGEAASKFTPRNNLRPRAFAPGLAR